MILIFQAAAAAAAVALSQAPAADPAPPQSLTILPAGTLVDLVVDDAISSKTGKEGDRFRLHLVDPIVRGGVILAPAGASGEGEIIHVRRPGLGGRAGELIIAARFLDYGGTRIPLGHFRWGRTGKDNTDLAIAASYAAVGIFITGGNVNVPAGTLASAQVTANVNLPAASAASVSSAQGRQP